MAALSRVALALFVPAVLVLSSSCGTTPAPTEPETPAVTVDTPVPVPTAPPRVTGCGVGRGPGNGRSCPRTSPNFLAAVDQALDAVGRKQPGLFDFNDIRGREGWYVKDIDGFYRAVVRELEEMGYCALVDGGNEIAVKKTNELSEQFHIMLSSRHVRRDDVSYRATCEPAWF